MKQFRDCEEKVLWRECPGSESAPFGNHGRVGSGGEMGDEKEGGREKRMGGLEGKG